MPDGVAIPAYGDKNNTIGFIVHRSFDPKNIKVTIDVLVNVFDFNKGNNCSYVTYSNCERVNWHIRKCLEIYKVPKNHYKFLSDDMDSEYLKDKMTRLFGKTKQSAYTLTKYRELIDVYNVDTLYIFTDNHKAIEIVEILKLAMKKPSLKIVTIDSNADYIDHSNFRNFLNHREATGGCYYNPKAKIIERMSDLDEHF